MRLTNYKVNFLGAQQNKKTQQYINDIVMSLTPRVPGGSSFVLNICEKEGGVFGEFTIIAASVRFESRQESDSGISLMDLICEDISQQIEYWIEKRVV